jgi:hypothetical protein
MARDDYAYLQTDTDRYFSTVSLAQLEKRLDGHGFFRVHRGYLVNLSMVEEVDPVSGGTLLLTLNGVDDKIPVSRRRVSALKKALGTVASAVRLLTTNRMDETGCESGRFLVAGPLLPCGGGRSVPDTVISIEGEVVCALHCSSK